MAEILTSYFAKTLTTLVNSDKTSTYTMPFGNSQQHNFSFSSPTIKRGVAVKKRKGTRGLGLFSPGRLTWDYWWTVINDHSCWPGKGGKKNCYQGNRDLVLNIPVTVIDECLCVGMSCTNMLLCMWQCAAAWQEKWLKTIQAPVMLCECAPDVHWVYTAHDCFVLEHVCCAPTVYLVLVLYTVVCVKMVMWSYLICVCWCVLVCMVS